MRSMCKRLLAIVSAILMLMTAMSSLVYAAPAEYTTLVVGNKTTAIISESNEIAHFAFKPSVTGYYSFTSDAENDSYGFLYDANMEELSHDDDSGDGLNFSITAQLTAGVTYYYGAKYLGSSTGSFTVWVEKMPSVVSVSVEPISVIENCDGHYDYYWDSETEQHQQFFRYYWWNELSYTVTFDNGQVCSGSGSLFSDDDGRWYSVEYLDNQRGPWAIGETQYQDIHFLNKSVTVPVTVVESPVQSIVVDPVYCIENYDGNESHYYDSEREEEVPYFRYDWWNMLQTTVTMKDGTVYTGSGVGIYDESGEFLCNIECDDNQYGNPWALGDTNTLTISVLGKSTTVSVSVIDNPIEHIDVEPIYLDGERDCYENEYWDEELQQWISYNYYRWSNQLHYTVHFKDGTSQVFDDGIIYNGKRHHHTTWDAQSSESSWVVGNDYTGTMTILGYEVEVPIYIIEHQTIDDVLYYEQADGIVISGTTGYGTTLTIPDTINNKPVIAITSLGGGEFEEIIIPDSVITISDDALDRCWYLEKITIGAGVAQLSNSLLGWQESLREIVVSEDNENYVSVDGIVYDKALTTMVAIPMAKTTSHTVPATVTNIELYMENTYGFGIVLQNNATGYVMEDGILYNADKTLVVSCDPNKTGDYVMPDSVREIRPTAFIESSLESVTISSNVTEIVYYSFYGSSNLQKVELPDNLTTIGFNAFGNCNNLSDITLPDTLTVLDMSAFQSTALQSITIPGGVDYIGSNAFAYSELKSVTLKEGICEIGSDAFYNTNLTTVTLPSTVHTVGNGAFNSTLLKSVDLGSVVYILSGAFGSTQLTSISIPKTLREIGNNAFADCKLTKLTVPATVQYMGEGAFASNPIKSLTLAEGITTTGNNTFSNIDITSLTLPQTVTDIAYYSFAQSDKLANIDLPDNLERLCGHAFDGTAWLQNQPDGVVYLENALYGYKGTMPTGTTVTVKNGTTLIADYAFDSGYFDEEEWDWKDGDQLKAVVLPKSVKNIGYAAFYGCGALKDVYYNGTEAEAKQIVIGERNEALTKATWHYNACQHTYKRSTTKATTTKDGKIQYVCSSCGYVSSKMTTVYKASSVKLSKTSYTYNGKVQKPSVIIKDSKGNTISSSHYTVSYSSGCKSVGTYSVKVTFKGNYSGTKTLTYKINPISVTKCKISLSATSYTYNGKVQKPSVIVKSPSGTKLSTSSYTVTYASGRKNVGTYKVTVKMKGNYSGTKTLTFKVIPAKTTLGTLTAGKKALTVKWTKKTTQVTGYQIQYSTTKSFKSYKTKTVSSYKTTSAKLTGLSAKKTYYVRIRTYKTVNGTKIYSGWSTIKYTKTK